MISKNIQKNLSLILLFPTLLAVGCSSSNKTEIPTAKVQKVYSEETQKTFEEIEREKVIESYRRLREEDWNQRERIRERQRVSRPAPKPVAPRPSEKPKQQTVKSSYRKADPAEIKIEIDQNRSFFCMKMRTTQRFSNEDECKVYTEGIYSDCQNKFEEDNPGLVTCVKSGLK